MSVTVICNNCEANGADPLSGTHLGAYECLKFARQAIIDNRTRITELELRAVDAEKSLFQLVTKCRELGWPDEALAKYQKKGTTTKVTIRPDLKPNDPRCCVALCPKGRMGTTVFCPDHQGCTLEE